MALENRKSLLQPSSTQAQQSRLQFTNLQPISLTAQQPSPVSNSRPTVSAFVSAPAPVSLQAPPTIPPAFFKGRKALPAPVPAPTPVVSNPPIVYSDTAFYFDGSSLFSSSLEPIDALINLTSSLGIMMAIKPNVWTTGSTQTILHMYSGSFASQSLAISLVNGAIQATFRNNGQTVTYSRNASSVGTLGNGYTLVTLEYFGNSEYDSLTNPFYGFPALQFNKDTSNTSATQTTQTSIESLSASFSNMDHLYIGGTQFEPNKNFQGAIGFVAFNFGAPYSSGYPNAVFNRRLSAKDLTSAGSYKTRVYTFGEPNGNAYAIETTGSAATKSVPLVLSGSVNTAQNYSYFTQ